MQVFLCDDSAKHCELQATILEEVVRENNWNMDIYSFASGEALLAEIQKRKREDALVPEVIISDIEMPGMDGISLGKLLKEEVPDSYLILLTSFTDYAIEGYETGAYRYLLKPLDKEQIAQVLTEIYESKDRGELWPVRRLGEETYIKIKDIVYISAEDKYLVIHTETGEYLDRGSLSENEETLLERGFFRIHRKYLVNMRHHKSVRGDKVVVTNDVELPISRRKEAAYRNAFMRFLEGGYLR